MPRTLIKPQDATTPFYWGVDVGGTSIKVGLVDSEGRTVAQQQIPTREPDGPQAAVDSIAQLLARIGQQLGVVEHIAAIGLGTPGAMDIPRGYLIDPPNLPHWWDFPIVQAVAQATGLPVSFINDANAAAYGEFWAGSGKQSNSMVLITLGTGVGGGIVVDDHLVNGVNSFGSELGHLIVDPSPEARLCVWGGGRGQLEAYASASAVVQRTAERLADGAESQLQALVAQKGADELSAKAIYEAAEHDDALALEIIDETAWWLGVGIASTVHMVDPGMVVLGGAMNFGGPQSPVGQRFLKAIVSQFTERTFPHLAKATKIEFAKLGPDAGYLGAAGYARSCKH